MELIDKKAFRKQMLQIRDALPETVRKAADEARNERILSWENYQEAELLLFYVSYRSEADTNYLIQNALKEGRQVAMPKVDGTEMVFYRITDVSQLVEGYKGIFEPDTGRTVPITGEIGESLLFVPGCAFDEKGGRMGYGGGFYDRFMEKHPKVKRVALAYEEQLVAEVPRETHDRAVDVIVTENRVIQVQKQETWKRR